jgi:hypothetical protein
MWQNLNHSRLRACQTSNTRKRSLRGGFSQVYALLAGLAGLLLVGRGPMWLGTDLPGDPFAKAALVRVLGAILVGHIFVTVILWIAFARTSAGESSVTLAVSSLLLHATVTHEDLTPRETDVLRQLALGRSNKNCRGSLRQRRDGHPSCMRKIVRRPW